MGSSGNVHFNGYAAVINDARIFGCGNPFCCRSDVTYGMGSAVSAQATDGVAAFFRFDLNISGAVGNGIHHFQAAGNPAEADRFIAFRNHSSPGGAVYWQYIRRIRQGHQRVRRSWHGAQDPSADACARNHRTFYDAAFPSGKWTGTGKRSASAYSRLLFLYHSCP